MYLLSCRLLLCLLVFIASEILAIYFCFHCCGHSLHICLSIHVILFLICLMHCRSFFHSAFLPLQVMWVRRTSEKVSLLTVGNVTYSSDPRIRVKFQYPNNWRLLINPTQWDDAGIYMCQVSTHPPRVFTTNLTVIGM